MQRPRRRLATVHARFGATDARARVQACSSLHTRCFAPPNKPNHSTPTAAANKLARQTSGSAPTPATAASTMARGCAMRRRAGEGCKTTYPLTFKLRRPRPSATVRQPWGPACNSRRGDADIAMARVGRATMSLDADVLPCCHCSPTTHAQPHAPTMPGTDGSPVPRGFIVSRHDCAGRGCSLHAALPRMACAEDTTTTTRAVGRSGTRTGCPPAQLGFSWWGVQGSRRVCAHPRA